MSRNFSTLYRFGPYRLAPDERRLQRGEEDVHLTPKAFDLLVLLVREAGHLQCRDALIERLWGHTVVEEHGLTWNVSALRRALGDCGESPAYIETVRGHGYRFVATVHVETEALPAASSATPRPSDRVDPGQPALPPAPPGTRHRLRPRWWWLTGAAMAVALAVALVPRQHASTGAKPRMHAARPTIAIVGFRNLSNDHDYDWIGDALSEMLGTDLVTGRTADLVPAADVMRAVRDLTPGKDKDFPAPAQLQRLRSMLGADASITGAYLRRRGPGDPRIRVDVQLVVHRHGTRMQSVTVTATGDDLFTLVGQLGGQLRARLGMVRLDPAQRSELLTSMPTRTDAAADYASGLSALASGQTLLARTLLQASIRQEPDFPLAHSALARAWLDLGDNHNAAAEARLALRHSAGLSYAQRQLLLGLGAEASHQWPQAIDAYRKLFDANPDSLNVGLMLTRVQEKAGRYHDARDTLDHLGRLPPPFGNDPRVMLASANLHADLDEYAAAYTDAMHAATRADALGQNVMQARALSEAAHARTRQNDFVQALDLAHRAGKLFAASDPDSLDAGINLQRIGIADDGLGRYDRAVAAYGDANELFARIGNRYWQAASLNNIAGVYFRRDRLDQALHSYRQALALFRDLHRDAAVAVVLNNLSSVANGMGRLDQAMEYEKQSLAVRRTLDAPRSVASSLFNLGMAKFALGRLDEAGDNLREARDIFLGQKAESDASDAVSALADLARVRNRLDQARKGYRKALAMRRRQHVATSVAWSRRDLAELDLDTGDPAHALQLARMSLPVFLKAGANADAMAARADIALALVRLGRRSETRKQSRLIDAGMASVSDRATRLGLDLARADLAHRLGNDAGAERILAGVLKKAQAMHMKSRLYPARLERLRLDADRGLDAAARSRGLKLIRDARQDGYLYVAAQARSILRPSDRRTAHADSRPI